MIGWREIDVENVAELIEAVQHFLAEAARSLGIVVAIGVVLVALTGSSLTLLATIFFFGMFVATGLGWWLCRRMLE